MSKSTFFITTPIYYINATPHVGHAYTQIAADARARFERARGRRVYFLTGTDENALKVARVAQSLGRDPQEYADELAASFRAIWDELGITYDDYVRTTEPRHRSVVRRVVEKLWDGGHLRIDTYSGWYSVPDETFFRAEETVERDGQQFIAAPSEDQTRDPLEWVEEQGHFFRLSQFQEPLLSYYDAHPGCLQPEARRNETLAFIRQGLRDTSISRTQDWGIPLPESVPHSQGRVVYVWFPDALLNYASAPGYLSEDPERRAFFEEVWPPDVHLMSKDIFTRFHTTLWPALLQALGLPLPSLCFAHGFWTVDGRKMSKRDPETIVEPTVFAAQIARASGCDPQVAVDALRYYCLREVTFGSDGDFSRRGCAQRYNSDLANGLGNLCNRALSMLHRYFDGVVPSHGPGLGLREKAESLLPCVESAYESMAFHEALALVWELVSDGNRLIEEQKPWAKIKQGQTEEVGTLIAELLSACQWCAVSLSPVMPHASARLLALLGIDAAPGAGSAALWSWATDWSMVPPGALCREPEPLFPRISALEAFDTPCDPSGPHRNPSPKEGKGKAMETQPATDPTSTATNANGSATPPATQQTSQEQEPGPESFIDYADFARVDLRIGKIIEAEKVPKADKLLRLQVDMGDHKRQILAGIAQQFDPEALVGTSVVVVANLAPRTLRGFESQGMILAASSPDGPPLALVSVPDDVPPGSVAK
jgi:methionyl-tRNA synthetase